MSLTFDEALHVYRLNGEVIPSVTQILKDTGLIDDQWFTHAARARGSATHKALELHAKGTLDESTVHPTVVPFFNAGKKFLAETKFVVHTVEERICSIPYRYGGTSDLRGRFPDCPDGWWDIVDYKTGGGAVWHAYQLAAYQHCHESPWKIRRWVVRLTKDERYILDQIKSDSLADWEKFLAFRTTWQHQVRRCNV